MAEYLGRNLVLKKNSVVLAGIRSKSVTVGVDNVDVTTDDDLGFRTLLSEAGQVNLDISFDGVETDGVVRDLILVGGTSQQYTDLTLTWPNGDVLSGTFNLGGYEEGGTYNDAVTFSSSLQSSGSWTYTPA
jgi:predicted secreted protein